MLTLPETLKEYVIPQANLPLCQESRCSSLSLLGILTPDPHHICQELSYLQRMSDCTDLTPQQLFDTVKARPPIKDCPELRQHPLFQPLLPFLIELIQG